MADGDKKVSVIRRMAGVGRPPPEIPRFDMARALKTAFAQAAQEEIDLVAAATRVGQARTTIGKLLESLPENALLTLLEGPQEQYGLLIFDAQSLAAFIEMQTTGRVVPHPAPERIPTRTDALLVSGFINRLLALFSQVAFEAELEAAASLEGYGYRQKLADAREVEMTLPDVPFRLFNVQAEFGTGAKQGQVSLLLPCEVAGATATPDAQKWHAQFVDLVQCAPVELEAILTRHKMPLSEVTGMRPGMQILLPREAIGQVVFCDLNGDMISMGQLGQTEGFRAVRLTGSCAEHENTESPAQQEFNAPNLAATQPTPGEAPGESISLPPEEPSDPGGLGDLGDMADFDLHGETDELPDLGALGNGEGAAPDLENLPDLSKL